MQRQSKNRCHVNLVRGCQRDTKALHYSLNSTFPRHRRRSWVYVLTRQEAVMDCFFSEQGMTEAMRNSNLFSCFILSLPKPFPPHSWEPWKTQTPFHASFWAFPNHSYPPSWEPRETQTPFHASFCPKPFPPHAWEPWKTQTPFHASFWAFPNPSHPTLGNHEKLKPFFMLLDAQHRKQSETIFTVAGEYLPIRMSTQRIHLQLVWSPSWCFFPRASEQRVLLIVEVCHHIFTSSHSCRIFHQDKTDIPKRLRQRPLRLELPQCLI